MCHKGRFHFLLCNFFIPSLKTLILLLLLPAVCVAKGRSPGAVTLSSSFSCRGHITHFRVVEPRLRHPELGRSWLVVDKKYRNLPFIYSLSFYPTSCFISSPCMVIYSLPCASGCLFHPRRKHQVLPDGCTVLKIFIKH